MCTRPSIITTYQATTSINPSTGPPPSPCDKWNALRCSPHWLQRGVPQRSCVARISTYHWVPHRSLEFEFDQTESQPAKSCIMVSWWTRMCQMTPWSSASRKNSWEKGRFCPLGGRLRSQQRGVEWLQLFCICQKHEGLIDAGWKIDGSPYVRYY